jgi:hypothetical protein
LKRKVECLSFEDINDDLSDVESMESEVASDSPDVAEEVASSELPYLFDAPNEYNELSLSWIKNPTKIATLSSLDCELSIIQNLLMKTRQSSRYLYFNLFARLC